MIHKYSDNPIFSKKKHKKPIFYFFHELQTIWGSHFRSTVRIFYKILHILFHFIQVIIYCEIKKKKTEEKEIPEKLRSII